MQQTTTVRATGAPEIPFGIRAIESGIEVEGVWISRSNTPASSRHGSPASSVVGDRTPPENQEHEQSTKAIPTLAMPQPLLPYQGHPASNHIPPSRTPEPQNERSFSTIADNGSSPDTIKIRIRPTYQPRHSSHLRFSSGDVHDSGPAPDQIHEQEEGSALSSYGEC